MPKTVIYLIRHAETVGNAEGIIQGQTVGGVLSKKGLRQAQDLREWARGKDIAAVYSSPLSRALETAGIAFPAIPITQVDDLMEQDAGEVSGMAEHEAFEFLHKRGISRLEEPKRAIDYFLLRYGHEFGGESSKDVYDRAIKSITKIADANRGKQVAVFSHGNLIKCVVCGLKGTPMTFEVLCAMVQHNACINILSYSQDGKQGEELKVESINGTGHLHSGD